jgi:hypothetical protein
MDTSSDGSPINDDFDPAALSFNELSRVLSTASNEDLLLALDALPFWSWGHCSRESFEWCIWRVQPVLLAYANVVEPDRKHVQGNELLGATRPAHAPAFDITRVVVDASETDFYRPLSLVIRFLSMLLRYGHNPSVWSSLDCLVTLLNCDSVAVVVETLSVLIDLFQRGNSNNDLDIRRNVRFRSRVLYLTSGYSCTGKQARREVILKPFGVDPKAPQKEKAASKDLAFAFQPFGHSDSSQLNTVSFKTIGAQFSSIDPVRLCHYLGMTPPICSSSSASSSSSLSRKQARTNSSSGAVPSSSSRANSSSSSSGSASASASEPPKSAKRRRSARIAQGESKSSTNAGPSSAKRKKQSGGLPYQSGKVALSSLLPPVRVLDTVQQLASDHNMPERFNFPLAYHVRLVLAVVYGESFAFQQHLAVKMLALKLTRPHYQHHHERAALHPDHAQRRRVARLLRRRLPGPCAGDPALSRRRAVQRAAGARES